MGDESNKMAEAVRTARDAVVDLEEPLKTEAFKILLAKLLSGDASEKDQGPARKRSSRVIPALRNKTAGSKKERKAPPPASTLKLDVGALKKLKAYCERFDLQGTEHVAFILANYIREYTDLEFVTAGDIAYLHRQLISQRLKVAPVNDPSDWMRALQWLTAPSRRKEWLEKSGAGFAVSNSGLLRFHEIETEVATRRDPILS
jgi:hypothetical protein